MTLVKNKRRAAERETLEMVETSTHVLNELNREIITNHLTLLFIHQIWFTLYKV